MKIKLTTLSLPLMIFFIGFSIVNLGKFLDITQKPSPSDVIVCLGGGDKFRTKKTLELYHKNYSKSHKVILFVPSKMKKKRAFDLHCKRKITNMKKEGVDSQNIVCIRNIHNTMQELLVVKDYLLSHQLKSALIVSDAPHSRRIIFLANKIVNFEESGLEIIVVGSDASWWDDGQYYKNKMATNATILEAVKLPYNYIKYGILYSIFAKYGILESTRKFLSPLAEDLRYSFAKFLDRNIN